MSSRSFHVDDPQGNRANSQCFLDAQTLLLHLRTLQNSIIPIGFQTSGYLTALNLTNRAPDSHFCVTLRVKNFVLKINDNELVILSDFYYVLISIKYLFLSSPLLLHMPDILKD